MMRKPIPLQEPDIGPANTLQELSVLLATEEVVSSLPKYEAGSLMATLRAMVKRLMTRNLAVTFSFTGLDRKRMRTKLSFKKHDIYRILLGAIDATSFGQCPRKDIDRALINVLKNVGDWDNFRGNLRKNDEQKHPKTGDDARLDFPSCEQDPHTEQSCSTVSPEVSSPNHVYCSQIVPSNLLVEMHLEN
ncbi:uncharacterized protein LOC108675907 [Hyalella azteca]|uniref:Uncharacterized protein LOC108675907 n=1 Tax=Hyalella azteca TaxID=294128 RepID=A0A979FU03_HYAAZ|nr:uncharacterized protein LOC108675907 [Hyalella azteca]